jgi:uncharacterized protein (TIGR02246 family)
MANSQDGDQISLDTTLRNDEQAIRELLLTWYRATASGDLPRLLTLMAEDVIYLVPGQPPMRGRDAFAAGFQAALQRFRIDAAGEIQELQITGDWAYCWTRLSVTMTPLEAGSPPVRRTGNTLSILRKQADGAWVLFRDANMLTAEPEA